MHKTKSRDFVKRRRILFDINYPVNDNDRVNLMVNYFIDYSPAYKFIIDSVTEKWG